MNVWESDREHLKKELDAEITERRIKKIAFIHDGKIVVNEVGVADPYAGGTVRVIYQDGKRGCYLVCGGGEVRLASKDAIVEEDR
jgi:hypothetical protein